MMNVKTVQGSISLGTPRNVAKLRIGAATANLLQASVWSVFANAVIIQYWVMIDWIGSHGVCVAGSRQSA